MTWKIGCVALLAAGCWAGEPAGPWWIGDGQSEFQDAPHQQANAKEDAAYQAARKALDAGRYEAAIKLLQQAIAGKGSHADAAYYWEAYALEHSGRLDEMKAAVAQLQKQFPNSEWNEEARALAMEMQADRLGRGAVQPTPRGADSDAQLKLLALNSLMMSDPQKAMPVLRKMLTSPQPREIKEKALFVAAQSGSPEGRELLLEVARSNSDPDLQASAVRDLGMMGGPEGQRQLKQVYESTSNLALKKEILQSYVMAGARPELLAAAQSEKDPDLRRAAIRALAQSGAKDEMWTLYQHETSPEVKRDIVESMVMMRANDRLLDIARAEKDPALKRKAIEVYGMTGGDSSKLVSIYRDSTDAGTKRAVVQSLFLQNNAKTLVELARQETHPELKRDIVEKLSLMHSKESTDYMLELLK